MEATLSTDQHSQVEIELDWETRGGTRTVRARVRSASSRRRVVVATELTEDVVLALLRDTAEGALTPDHPDLVPLHELIAHRDVRDVLHRGLDDLAPSRPRLRLLLSADDDPELPTLPWELVRLPAWPGAGPESARPLGRHDRISLIRVLANTGPTPARQRWGPIVVAAARAVAGAVSTPNGTRTVTALPALAGQERDLVREALGVHGGVVVDGGDPATVTSLRSALRDRAFGFHFGGHHVDGGVILDAAGSDPAPGGARWWDARELADAVARAEVVVAVLVACRGADPPGGPRPSIDVRTRIAELSRDASTAEVLVAAGVPFVVALRGDIRDDAARRFTHEFYRLLAERTPIDQAVADAGRHAEDYWRRPCFPVLYTSWDQEDFAVADPAASIDALDLRAYRVPPGWTPTSGPCPVGDEHVANLGVVCCLDRGPFTAVVADLPGRALRDALDETERHVIGAGLTILRGFGEDLPERRWIELDGGEQVPNGRSDLERRLPAAAVPGSGTWQPGFVVGRRSGPYRHDLAGGDRSARAWLDTLRALFPQAAVVFHVRSDTAFDAVAHAADVGRSLASRAGKPPFEVLSRVRPGAPVANPMDAGADPPENDPAKTALRMLASIARERRVRALPADWTGAQGMPPGLDPVAVARAVVQALEIEQVWGDPVAEARSIAMVRDHLPDYFPALQAEHTARRTGPARYASLAVAAAFDDDVDRWLAGASLGPLAAVPRGLRDTRLIEAVLLGLARGLAPPGSWGRAHGRAAAARRVLGHMDPGNPDSHRGADDGALIQDGDAAIGVAAARAGLGLTMRPSDLAAPAGSAAWWALLGRRRLTEEVVTWLTGLDASVRRAVGFVADRYEPDSDLVETAEILSRSVRPPLV